jgi:hypothetical protein
MICTRETFELVECARRGEAPDAALRAHLEECPKCAERYASECNLSSCFGAMRIGADRIVREGRPLAWAHRESLMRDFGSRARRPLPSWAWGLAAAASLVLVIGAGRELGIRTRRPATIHPAVLHQDGAREDGNQMPWVYVVSDDADSSSTGSASTGFALDEDFIPVPFAPPLATGERLTVVRAELDPEELASMGIDVDPSRTDLSAEMVMGQDGLPRAVRIADNSDF